MASPPSASPPDVHPHSPRLHSDNPPVCAAEPSSAPDPGIPSIGCSTFTLAHLASASSSSEYSQDDGIAAWRETTPLARLLAFHRRSDDAEETSARAPAGAQNTAAAPAREPTCRAEVDPGPSSDRREENGGPQEERSGDKGKTKGVRAGTTRK